MANYPTSGPFDRLRKKATSKKQKDPGAMKATKVGPTRGPTPNAEFTGGSFRPNGLDPIAGSQDGNTEGWRGPLDPDAGMTTKRK